jgi:hypothetical protein
MSIKEGRDSALVPRQTLNETCADVAKPFKDSELEVRTTVPCWDIRIVGFGGAITESVPLGQKTPGTFQDGGPFRVARVPHPFIPEPGGNRVRVSAFFLVSLTPDSPRNTPAPTFDSWTAYFCTKEGF